MSSFVDSLLSLAIAKQDKMKEDTPEEGDLDSDQEGGAGSSHTSQAEYNGAASQQSTSADELENDDEPTTKRFRADSDQTLASSSFSAKVNLAELALNVKALSHQVDLVMKKLNVRPCECKDCFVIHNRMAPGTLKRPRPAASTPVTRTPLQNGETAPLTTSSSVPLTSQAPSVGMTPPINGVIAQALVEQTHCPTIRGRGRGRPMLIGDELHNALVDYLVNLEIVNNIRLYPMDAFQYAREFIKQHSPGLLSDEGGSVVLKQSWAVKLVTHVRTRKQKLVQLVQSANNEQPEDIISRVNKELGMSAKQSRETLNNLNGFASTNQQHVVPDQSFVAKSDYSQETAEKDIVVEKFETFEMDSSKLAIDADPASIATFASIIASLQQQQQQQATQ